MSRQFLVALALSCLLAACSDSSDSGSQLQYDFSAAQDWLDRFLAEEEGFDGAAMIVVDRRTGVLHRYAAGIHSVDTIYLLASVSKVPSVSLLMALADDPDRDFDLDTPIENYLPFVGVYPGITTASANIGALEGAGYLPLGFFFLPPRCWLENYYEPLAGRTVRDDDGGRRGDLERPARTLDLLPRARPVLGLSGDARPAPHDGISDALSNPRNSSTVSPTLRSKRCR